MSALTELALALYHLIVELSLMRSPYVQYLGLTLPATVLSVVTLCLYLTGSALWRYETHRHR